MVLLCVSPRSTGNNFGLNQLYQWKGKTVQFVVRQREFTSISEVIDFKLIMSLRFADSFWHYRKLIRFKKFSNNYRKPAGSASSHANTIPTDEHLTELLNSGVAHELTTLVITFIHYKRCIFAGFVIPNTLFVLMTAAHSQRNRSMASRRRVSMNAWLRNQDLILEFAAHLQCCVIALGTFSID